MKSRWKAWLAVGLFVFIGEVTAHEPRAKLQFDTEKQAFTLSGFSEEFMRALVESPQVKEVFRVGVVGGESAVSAMAGSYHLSDGGLIRFEPRFPLAKGVEYRAIFDSKALPDEINAGRYFSVEATFSLGDGDPVVLAHVDHVYPSSNRLPENLLKFYIHFNRPMSRGEAYKNIRLLGEDGGEVPRPFLELEEELWDDRQQRFTLFFDPGRVKRGLRPHQEEGRPLKAGRRYTLEILPDWKDARRRSLVEPFRKEFEVIGADYDQPDVERWKIGAVSGQSKEGLRIDFGEAMDQALLGRVLSIQDARGTIIEGDLRIGKGEKHVVFIPVDPWAVGDHFVVAENILEDLAGNSLGRLFEKTEGATLSEQPFLNLPIQRKFVIEHTK